ncbi:glycosyltransferase [Piscinibacter sp.]|uniref:glycosyltransferase n=1 Tax=Piscinibacter sp. TaxID=1903157 RepID=UPI003559DCDC
MSCVILSYDNALSLSHLLPTLSDTLTECGYPWEVIVVNAGSDDATNQLLRGWSEIPGFWTVPLSTDAGQAMALAVGLAAARGDAVILLDAKLHYAPSLLAQMIMQWENGAELVYAVRNAAGELTELAGWDAATVDRMMNAADSMNLPQGSTDLALMDRRVVKFLLA